MVFKLFLRVLGSQEDASVPLSKVKENRWGSGHLTQPKQLHYICLNIDDTIKLFIVIIKFFFMLKSKKFENNNT